MAWTRLLALVQSQVTVLDNPRTDRRTSVATWRAREVSALDRSAPQPMQVINRALRVRAGGENEPLVAGLSASSPLAI